MIVTEVSTSFFSLLFRSSIFFSVVGSVSDALAAGPGAGNAFPNVIAILLEAGADPKIKNKTGKTPKDEAKGDCAAVYDKFTKVRWD